MTRRKKKKAEKRASSEASLGSWQARFEHSSAADGKREEGEN